MIVPLPPVAAGAWNSAMAVFTAKTASETEPMPKSGAASVSTVTVKVSRPRSAAAMLASPSCAVMVTVAAAAAVVGVPQTRRAWLPGQPGESDPVASKRSPSGRFEAAYVMAPLPPLAAGTVNSSMAWPATKVLAETAPLPKVGTAFASTVTENVSVARSVFIVLPSESRAAMVTVTAEAAVVGVPQISRASVPGQPFVSAPVASKTRPAGRPEAA